MNKRLHQLANEARVEVSQRIGYNDRDREVAFEEKFAELIVKECATVQHKRFCEHGDVSWDILMEHFGVKG